MTFNFDDIPTGQLLNPYLNFWFSEGFLVQRASESPYESVAGAQLAEFIPAPLSNGRFNSTHDLAMISVGPQSSNTCFQFNLQSLSLGCASNRTFQDCHFWIWGLRHNSTTGREENVVASQDVPTLACTRPRCNLTTKEFYGSYKNLTSIIIQIRSGGKSRLWWADNLVVEWADDSCAATKCREKGVFALEGISS
ncbi:hypothetical protein SAPIO_CDS1776 [Scedosporium apiospermum]|uniref:DUF7371 domain-containing protein n=1 Tax=Pseudallescheria apiosperma TaxID=563466 RepID=A0A084GDQ0_PSEDA|nr:uncharacterized protein SAPIO_CDS1776 [Scedosporium apiospermum]KEZ45462.1 hypothetical protein SAPIO_CDS1776 [Scedosporium apiospermum]